MEKLDFTDIKILSTVFKTRSISASADEVGLGQSAISIRLGRLREHFGDSLFVRTSQGMQPTARMESIITAVHQAIALFENTLPAGTEFDPSTVVRTFRISLTDGGQLVILPRLLERLRAQAPRLHIEAIPLGQDTARMLEMGETELAMGFTLDIPQSFFQQKLYSEHYVCLFHRNHPRIGSSLNLEKYLAEGHVHVTARGTGHWIMNKALDEQGICRDILVQVPSFLALAQIVAETDLIALVPSHMAKLLVRDMAVRYLPVPFPLPNYDIRQFWHERYHRDPCNRWVRSQVADIFCE